ncbi:MAG: DUF928 domain-containing protein [Cyanobacteria bacterium P01_F01_bin.13]
MNQFSSPLKRRIATLPNRYRLLSAFLVGILGLGMMAPSNASERIRWTPDTDRGNVGSTLSGGRRGYTATSCTSSNTPQLSLMVPGDHSRLLTTVTNPTMAWHMNTDIPISMTFHFSDPTEANPIYTQTINLEKTATVSVTLPQDKSLAVGKKYRWTVLVSCPGENQTEISARSFVERVDRESLVVTNNLSSLEQARIYANQGIWYDAIAALLAAGSQGETDAETMVQNLLEQGQSPAEVTLSAVMNF